MPASMKSLKMVECIAVALLVLANGTHADDRMHQILKGVRADSVKLQPWLSGHRRWLNKTPELAQAEAETSAYIRRELKTMRIKFQTDAAGNSIVATVGSGAPKVALRAAMDAVLIKEMNDTADTSRTSGMHASGSDAHVAMLLGAAKLLKAKESSIKGTIVFLFQSGGDGIAAKVMSGGPLKGAAAIAGIQVSPDLPRGTVSTKAGVMTSASDSFSITVTGQGGLAGQSHNVRHNPVLAAAAVMYAIQLSAAKEMNSAEEALVTISQLHSGGGGGYTVTDAVEIQGAIFSRTSEGVPPLRQGVAKIASSVAEAYNCEANSSWSSHFRAPIVNDEDLAHLMEDAAQDVASFQQLDSPTTAVNDFSALTGGIPSVYGLLGIRNNRDKIVPALHTTRFTMDDSQLPTGAALQASLALRVLDHLSDGHATKRPPSSSTETGKKKRALPAHASVRGHKARTAVKVVPWHRSLMIDLFTGAMVVLYLWVPVPALDHQVVREVFTHTAPVVMVPSLVLKTD